MFDRARSLPAYSPLMSCALRAASAHSLPQQSSRLKNDGCALMLWLLYTSLTPQLQQAFLNRLQTPPPLIIINSVRHALECAASLQCREEKQCTHEQWKGIQGPMNNCKANAHRRSTIQHQLSEEDHPTHHHTHTHTHTHTHALAATITRRCRSHPSASPACCPAGRAAAVSAASRG